MRTATKRVYTVCASEINGREVGRGAGLGEVYRFGKAADAERLAAVATMHGRSAFVTVEDVPKRLADRWGV